MMNADEFGDSGGVHFDGAGIGQVLVHLDSLKSEIIQEVQSRTDALRQESEGMRRDVIEKLAAVSVEVEKVVMCISRTVGSPSSGMRIRGTAEGKKRSVPDPDDVPFLGFILDKEHPSLPLLRCVMMTSVFSFIRTFPEADSWLTEKQKENLRGAVQLLNDVSGFSLLFFSVASDDSKARFRSKTGRLWSWVCTTTIVIMLLSARASYFDVRRPGSDGNSGETVHGRALPNWLSSFGGLNKSTGIVGSVVEALEQTGTVPLSQSKKKARRDEESSSSGEDPLRGQREQSVRSVRSVLLRVMSTGRHDARMHIFKSFLFLVEKIRSFNTVAEARAEGYEIGFTEASSDAELSVPHELTGSIWDIPKTRTQANCDAEGNNSRALQDLASNFPSLTVCLRYRRRVKRRHDSSADNCAVEENGETYWDVAEDLPLHRVALGLLVDMFRTKTFHAALQSSGLSRRTVHIFAIALRGLIRKGLEMRLSALEVAALGDVTFRTLDKNEDLATVMLGSRNEKAKDNNEKTSLDRERVEVRNDLGRVQRGKEKT